MKVSATNSALNLISELQEKYGEKLMFHQSGAEADRLRQTTGATQMAELIAQGLGISKEEFDEQEVKQKK